MILKAGFLGWTAFLSEMPPLNIDESLKSQLPGPDKERDLRLFLELLKSTRQLNVTFLQHIRRIDAAAQSLIQSEFNQPFEPIAMFGKL
jgi:hypothetical protein